MKAEIYKEIVKLSEMTGFASGYNDTSYDLAVIADYIHNNVYVKTLHSLNKEINKTINKANASPTHANTTAVRILKNMMEKTYTHAITLNNEVVKIYA